MTTEAYRAKQESLPPPHVHYTSLPTGNLSQLYYVCPFHRFSYISTYTLIFYLQKQYRIIHIFSNVLFFLYNNMFRDISTLVCSVLILFS